MLCAAQEHTDVDRLFIYLQWLRNGALNPIKPILYRLMHIYLIYDVYLQTRMTPRDLSFAYTKENIFN